MYLSSVVIVLSGLSTLISAAAAYDDGMYHPGTTTVTQGPPSTTGYASEATWYPTASKSTYMGYWSSNSTATTYTKPMTTESYKSTEPYMSTNTSHTMSGHISNNMTSYMGPANGTMTMTSGRVYTTTVCDLQSSCHVVVTTTTGGNGMVRTADMPPPTMTPFSSSDRLLASGWGALALCGIALLL